MKTATALYCNALLKNGNVFMYTHNFVHRLSYLKSCEDCVHTNGFTMNMLFPGCRDQNLAVCIYSYK